MRQFAAIKGVSAPTIMRACRSGEIIRGPDGIDETIPQNAGWTCLGTNAGRKAPAKEPVPKTPKPPKSPRPPPPPRIQPVVVHTGPLPKALKGKALVSKNFRIAPSDLITQEMGDRIEEIAKKGESFQAAIVSVCPQDVDKAFNDYYARKRFTDGHIALHGGLMDRINDASAVVYARMRGEERVTLSDGKEIEIGDVTVALASELAKQRTGVLSLLRKGLCESPVPVDVAVAPGDGNGSAPDGKNDPLSIQVTYVKPPPRETNAETPKD